MVSPVVPSSAEEGPGRQVDFFDPSQEDTSAHLSTSKAVLAVTLSTVLGGLLGLGLEFSQLEMPFFFEEILLGLICAVSTAYSLGKIQEMPEGLLMKRLGPAAGFGTLVGLCLFGIWWSFDPPVGFVAIGAVAGFCSGIPIAVSFGLTGGQSRPLGRLEFGNVLLSMGLGFVIACFVGLGDEYDPGFDFYIVPGISGTLALVPTLFGGRISLAELMAHLDSFRRW